VGGGCSGMSEGRDFHAERGRKKPFSARLEPMAG
jgi:hypothetical protein